MDRQRRREARVKATAKAEAGKQRSVDSRYALAQQQAEARAANGAGGTSEPPPKAAAPPASLAPGWYATRDPASGQFYYWHRTLGTVQWEPPRAAEPDGTPPPAAEPDGALPAAEPDSVSAAGEVQSAEPAPVATGGLPVEVQ